MFSGLIGRGILYALIVGACYMYINALQARITRSEAKYANLVADIDKKTAIREAENKIKLENAKLEAEKTMQSHLEQSTAVFLNFDTLLKREKAKNENLVITVDMLNNERNSLRDKIANIDFTMPKGNSNEFTESERNSYATLIEACRLTTIDYNALRQAFDTNCTLTGCE
jgi:uncharacterized membrane protein YhiD involved in acid resistance